MLSGLPTVEELIPQVENVLNANPQGISEYEFLTQLGEKVPFFCSQQTRSANLRLFQRHFLLFHCLYQLDHLYRTQHLVRIGISPLEIRLIAGEKEDENDAPSRQARQLDTPDSVREYYLDLSNLENTGDLEVDELLGKFWLALARHDARDDALKLLGLSDPIDNTSIRKRYREMVMQHHPDRGGETGMLQQLNSAISKLLPKS
jgi:hypothetical protein